MRVNTNNKPSLRHADAELGEQEWGGYPPLACHSPDAVDEEQANQTANERVEQRVEPSALVGELRVIINGSDEKLEPRRTKSRCWTRMRCAVKMYRHV